jgi:hypothetical protein
MRRSWSLKSREMADSLYEREGQRVTKFAVDVAEDEDERFLDSAEVGEEPIKNLPNRPGV